jgi:hypothetical protein
MLAGLSLCLDGLEHGELTAFSELDLSSPLLAVVVCFGLFE